MRVFLHSLDFVFGLANDLTTIKSIAGFWCVGRLLIAVWIAVNLCVALGAFGCVYRIGSIGRR